MMIKLNHWSKVFETSYTLWTRHKLKIVPEPVVNQLLIEQTVIGILSHDGVKIITLFLSIKEEETSSYKSF
jgi:hypothetical protein